VILVLYVTKTGEVRPTSLAAINKGNLSRIAVEHCSCDHFPKWTTSLTRAKAPAKAPQARKTIKTPATAIRPMMKKFWIGQEPRMRLLLMGQQLDVLLM
jgi:hypothetical protein